jgi:histidinol-phosphate aminotransferase
MNPLLRSRTPEILALKPYSHAAVAAGADAPACQRGALATGGRCRLGGLNRYPEPQPAALIARLAALYGVRPANLLATRGSDEAIDLLSRIFLRAGVDAIMQCTPTFGMYQVAARIQGAGVIDVPLQRTHGWRLDVDRVLGAWTPQVKIVYLCSPNNPTANLLDATRSRPFAMRSTARPSSSSTRPTSNGPRRHQPDAWLDRYPTLAILRTLSKAYALAGARIGALLGAPELIEMARRVVPPYCLAQPTIEAALRALDPAELEATRARSRCCTKSANTCAEGLAASASGGDGLAERHELLADRQPGCRRASCARACAAA